MTTLYRSHVWPALMVSCHLVEAAAAVAATLTGLLLSNWWIILLLIWPPKAGNARLFLTVYKLSLCYYTLWKKKRKNTAALHWRTCTIWSKLYIQICCLNLWTFVYLCDRDVDLGGVDASHRRCCLVQVWGSPLRLWMIVKERKDSHPATERKMNSVT